MSRLLPTTGGIVDVCIVLALGVLALLGFGTTFEGSAYLLVGGVALLIGVLLSSLASALRLPMVALAALTLIAYFAAGPPLVFPGDPWLSPDTLRMLAIGATLGWKQLLTTTPPLEPGSPLLVVPFLLGLVTGVAGSAAAQRLFRRSHPGTFVALARAGAPALVSMLTLAVVLAFGTSQPAAKLLNGMVFAVICLVWVSARLRRMRPPARTTTRPVRRALVAAGVIAIAAAVATVGAPLLPGAQHPRAVLRDYIVPPFDLSAYPSPLVGFRKYTKDAKRLWDQELFTMSGLPQGASVRIATLDDYDGSVWGATDETSFRLVSSRITPNPIGPISTVRVTIGPAYAAALDVNAWVPETGIPSRVDFAGGRARELSASLHYNRQLSAGIVTARLRTGDSYTLETTFADHTLPEDLQPYGRPALTANTQAVLSNKVAAWTKDGNNLKARIDALAAYLQKNGAYTDGGPGESQYLPGHSIGRLTAFLQDKQPAGDDEQYAAVFALAANYLGMPARVVLGARPGSSGMVRGKDVHVWVELHLADDRWVAVPESLFMPDPSKRPSQQPPKSFENKELAIVPPPNAGRLPRTPTDTSRVDPFPQKPHPVTLLGQILAFLAMIAPWAGPPLLLIGLFVGTVRFLKRRRSKRRRRHGLPANRHAAAWQQVVDDVRDLAEVKLALRTQLPERRATRQEQALLLDRTGILPGTAFTTLAARIDEIVYGATEPTVVEAADFWIEMDGCRRELTAGLSRIQRWRVALSLRSLLSSRRKRSRRMWTFVLVGGRAR